jgi:hypothetical protein
MPLVDLIKPAGVSVVALPISTESMQFSDVASEQGGSIEVAFML